MSAIGRPISETIGELQRRMAIVLEFMASRPELPTPTHININPTRALDRDVLPHVDWLIHGDGTIDEQRAAMQQIVRALQGKADKMPSEEVLYVRGVTDSVAWTVGVDRPAACTAVVVGKKTIRVPDPNVRVPLVDQVVDDIVWECEPILADRD